MRRTTEAENRKYVESRFSGQRIGTTREVRLRCSFHDDRNPSMSWNLEKGAWKCFSGCGEGGLVDFEQKLNGGTREEAWHRICEVMGAEDLFEAQKSKPVATYPYHDPQGRLLFEKLRYEPKRFVLRRPNSAGGYDYKLGDVQKALYNLPSVITANVVVVCEGEKDCDRVARLKFGDDSTRVAATTNFEGAGKWRDEYSPYLIGKRVVILPDNDAPGRAHAEMVARSVAKYAAGVRIVNLPGLPEKGDVSDYLDSQNAEDLTAEIKRAPSWRPVTATHKMLAEGVQFASTALPEVDWLVQDAIQRGGNGVLTGEPKAAKSMTTIDLALAIATGTPWLGKRTRRAKVALVSREDWPGLTAQRIANFSRGSQRALDLEGWLWINTRLQTPNFLLEDDVQLVTLIDELKQEHVEFCVFDVFRRLHTGDENDNSQMAAILERLTRVQNEVGCAICLVHHTNREVGGSIFRRIRGATAIHGWVEWAMGVTVTNPEATPREYIRKIEFETKAACPADPIYFQIESGADTLRLELKDPPEPAGRRPVRTSSSFMKGAQA